MSDCALDAAAGCMAAVNEAFLSVSSSSASGAALALSGRVAGAHLHRAGQEQEEPVLLVLQQRDRIPASQTTGGRPLRLPAEAPRLAGLSDRHRNRSVHGQGGRHLHDGQSAQRCDPGLLHVLLLSDATRVRTGAIIDY